MHYDFEPNRLRDAIYWQQRGEVMHLMSKKSMTIEDEIFWQQEAAKAYKLARKTMGIEDVI